MAKYYRHTIYFITLCMCFSIIASAFLMRTGTAELLDRIDETIGNRVYISGDYEDAWNLNSDTKLIADNEKMFDIQKRLKNSYDVQNCLMKELYAVTYNTGSVVSNDLFFHDEICEAFINNDQQSYFTDADNEETIKDFLKTSYVSVIGDSKSDLLYHWYNDELFYYNSKKDNIEFNLFTEEEMNNGEMVCYIPKNSIGYSIDSEYNVFPDARELGVDDTIILADFYVNNGEIVFVNKYELTVKGLYYTKDSSSIGNTVFVPQNTLLKIQEQEYELYSQFNCDIADLTNMNEAERACNLSKPTYALQAAVNFDSVDKLEELTQYLKEECRDISGFSLKSSRQEYSQLTSVIKETSSISIIILRFAVIISSVLILLIVMLQTRSRKKEIGLLMAMGESTGSIIKKYTVEMMVITILALVVSLLLGAIGGKLLSSRLFENYRIPKEVFRSPTNVEIEKMVRSFKLGYTANDIVKIISLCIATTIIPYILNIKAITKLKPRNVLFEDK